jgi:hypothetical protein
LIYRMCTIYSHLFWNYSNIKAVDVRQKNQEKSLAEILSEIDFMEKVRRVIIGYGILIIILFLTPTSLLIVYLIIRYS